MSSEEIKPPVPEASSSTAATVGAEDAKMEVDVPVKEEIEFEVLLPEVLEGKSEEEIAAVKQKILHQLEFYFSDSNLPFDKFLFTLTLKNPSGSVPLHTVASFKRMQEYTNTYGLDFIASCVKASEELAVEKNGEGDWTVRRQRKLERDTTAWERSIYVKGFGEGKTEHNSQQQVEDFFAQFGSINAVRFRRGDDAKGTKGRGESKGSVFTEFKFLEEAKKFLALEPKPTFQGEELVSMSKEDYVQMKVKEKGLDVASIKRNTPGSGSGAPVPKKFNAFKEMEKIKASGGRIPAYLGGGEAGNGGGDGKRKREDDGEARGKKVKQEEEPLFITYNDKKVQVDRKTGAVVDKNELVYPERAVLKFVNCGADSDWKKLKADLVEAGIEKTFINFPKGQSWGFFALPETIEDDKLEMLKGLKLIVGEQEIDWERVVGDEERNFYAVRASFQGKLALKAIAEAEAEKAKFAKESKGGRGGRGGGRGGNRNDRGGRGGRGGGRGGNRGGRGGDRDGGDVKPTPMDADLSSAMQGNVSAAPEIVTAGRL